MNNVMAKLNKYEELLSKLGQSQQLVNEVLSEFVDEMKDDIKVDGKGNHGIMNNKQKLINSMNEIMKRESSEPEYEDFVTREEFINRTRVLVSPTHFYHVYSDFKKSGLSVDKFISSYEEKNDEIIELSLQGTLKYNISDDLISLVGLYDDEFHEPNIYEIINGLLLFEYGEHENKVKLTEKYIRNLENVIRILAKNENNLNRSISKMTS